MQIRALWELSDRPAMVVGAPRRWPQLLAAAAKAQIRAQPPLYRLYFPYRAWRDNHYVRLGGGYAYDLCVEGYPSSGNSLTRRFLSCADPGLKISGHTHAYAHVRIARAHGVPVVIVVRPPEQAVASRVARFGTRPDGALLDYVDFHARVARDRERLAVIRFADVVADPAGTLAAVRERTGLALDALSGAKAMAQAQAIIQRTSERADGSVHQRSVVPDDAKEARKEQVLARLHQSPYWPAARAAYDRLFPGERGG